jgi:SAM-dependent methyltransferase
MPTLEWNKDKWDKEYNWDLRGEEWSQSWGNSEAQWFSSLYPRIHRFIACDNVLEIACGYGRWTKYLQEYAINKFMGVDLSSECIQYCKQHFKDDKTSFYQNDGVSLKDVSIIKHDFVFSFDSLVHVNPHILKTYIQQIMLLLKDKGVCFIHHSNFGAIIEAGGINESHKGFTHFRDQKTSAEIVRQFILQYGGKVLCQEIVDWGGGESIDCLTTFCKKDAFPKHNEKKITNNQFMTEADIIKKVHSNYCKL